MNATSYLKNAAILVFLSLAIKAQEAEKSDFTVSRANGGTIQTQLSSTIVLDKGSSLNREWICVNEAAMPVQLSGTPGVKTLFVDGENYSRGSYEYRAKIALIVDEPITAIEIRFLTFDVWGVHVRTLSLTEIRDFEPGEHSLDGRWQLYSENEASEYYASIAFIARVRTKSGKVILANTSEVFEQAKKFSASFKSTDMDPEGTGKPSK